MQPIRRILEDAPDAVPVPEELRHRRVEHILWPLDQTAQAVPTCERPKFNVADVDLIDIPAREERNARR